MNTAYQGWLISDPRFLSSGHFKMCLRKFNMFNASETVGCINANINASFAFFLTVFIITGDS